MRCMKAKNFRSVITLDQIPNIGKAIAKELRAIGVFRPHHLKGQDPIALFKKINAVSGAAHDPSLADVLMAAVDFMNGGTAKPASDFTEQRKKLLKK